MTTVLQHQAPIFDIDIAVSYKDFAYKENFIEVIYLLFNIFEDRLYLWIDILKESPGLSQFDYIFTHNLFRTYLQSWVSISEDVKNHIFGVMEFDTDWKENGIHSFYIMYCIFTAREDIYMIYKNNKDVVICSEYKLTEHIDWLGLVFNLSNYVKNTIYDATLEKLYDTFKKEYERWAISLWSYFKSIAEQYKNNQWIKWINLEDMKNKLDDLENNEDREKSSLWAHFKSIVELHESTSGGTIIDVEFIEHNLDNIKTISDNIQSGDIGFRKHDWEKKFIVIRKHIPIRNKK